MPNPDPSFPGGAGVDGYLSRFADSPEEKIALIQELQQSGVYDAAEAASLTAYYQKLASEQPTLGNDMGGSVSNTGQPGTVTPQERDRMVNDYNSFIGQYDPNAPSMDPRYSGGNTADNYSPTGPTIEPQPGNRGVSAASGGTQYAPRSVLPDWALATSGPGAQAQPQDPNAPGPNNPGGGGNPVIPPGNTPIPPTDPNEPPPDPNEPPPPGGDPNRPPAQGPDIGATPWPTRDDRLTDQVMSPNNRELLDSLGPQTPTAWGDPANRNTYDYYLGSLLNQIGPTLPGMEFNQRGFDTSDPESSKKQAFMNAAGVFGGNALDLVAHSPSIDLALNMLLGQGKEYNQNITDAQTLAGRSTKQAESLMDRLIAPDLTRAAAGDFDTASPEVEGALRSSARKSAVTGNMRAQQALEGAQAARGTGGGEASLAKSALGFQATGALDEAQRGITLDMADRRQKDAAFRAQLGANADQILRSVIGTRLAQAQAGLMTNPYEDSMIEHLMQLGGTDIAEKLGQNVSNPMGGGSQWGGAAAGALSGASAGTTVFPGVGTAIGAILGGISGYFS